MAKNVIRHGDVFAVPLPDRHFLFGRVMLDIYGTTKRRLFPTDSPLPGLGKTFLIEMYTAVSPRPELVESDVLIPGAFLQVDEFGKAWPIIGHIPIDPRDVRFPETTIAYMHRKGEAAFECGEIRLPLPISFKQQRSLGVYKTSLPTLYWAYICLRYLGRTNEIPEEVRAGCTLADSDLRFTDHRLRIYKHLPIDPNASYYEQQAQLGLNLDRLYQ